MAKIPMVFEGIPTLLCSVTEMRLMVQLLEEITRRMSSIIIRLRELQPRREALLAFATSAFPRGRIQ